MTRSPSTSALATAIAAVLSLMAGAARAQDVPLHDYVIRRGDTCAGIARREFGDARRYDLIHANNDLGRQPHRLRPGLVLHLPPGPGSVPTEPDARLTFVRNRVEAYTPDQHSGKRYEPLSRGHRVSTLAASSA